MENVQNNIEEVFTKRLFRIPDYQRGYAWEEQQWGEFLEDLELLGENKEHYTGTLVLDTVDQPPRQDSGGTRHDAYEVVDGQQRLTTVVLLLDSIRREMRKDETNKWSIFAEGIRENYVSVTDIHSKQPIYKLQLNDNDNGFFVDEVLNGEPTEEGTKNYSQERLAKARKYFADYLQNQRHKDEVEYETWLLNLHNKVTSQLRVSLYFVETKADVGVIFEVMNNRGKPISELDKVKNYLLYLASKSA